MDFHGLHSKWSFGLYLTRQRLSTGWPTFVKNGPASSKDCFWAVAKMDLLNIYPAGSIWRVPSQISDRLVGISSQKVGDASSQRSGMKRPQVSGKVRIIIDGTRKYILPFVKRGETPKERTMVRFVQTQGHAKRCDRAAVQLLMLLLRVGERKKKKNQAEC